LQSYLLEIIQNQTSIFVTQRLMSLFVYLALIFSTSYLINFAYFPHTDAWRPLHC